MQVLDIPAVDGNISNQINISSQSNLSSSDDEKKRLYYDPEWLAVLKTTYSYMDYRSRQTLTMPKEPVAKEIIQENLNWVKENMSNFEIPENFVQTAVPYKSKSSQQEEESENENDKEKENERVNYEMMEGLVINPQTALLCNQLGIPNPCVLSLTPQGNSSSSSSNSYSNNNSTTSTTSTSITTSNPDAIDIDDFEEDDEANDRGEEDEEEEMKPTTVSSKNPDMIDIDYAEDE